MKLQDLRVLMTVVEAGTMGKAARRLNTSQPAISRSIAELESALGVCLLDRHRQGISPTEYGRALLDCAVAVFDDLRRGISAIEFLADPTAGEIRIGTISALAATFVSAVIDRLSRRHPHIVFHLITEDLPILRRELIERNVDLLIVQKFDVFSEQQLDFEILYDASYVITAGVQNPWARRRKIHLSELMNEVWVLPPPDSGFGPVAVNAFRASGCDYPRATVFTAQADVRISLVKSGRFLSIFTTSVLGVPSKYPELKALSVALPTAKAPVGIITLKNRTLSPVARLFVTCAREAARLLAKEKA